MEKLANKFHDQKKLSTRKLIKDSSNKYSLNLETKFQEIVISLKTDKISLQRKEKEQKWFSKLLAFLVSNPIKRKIKDLTHT